MTVVGPEPGAITRQGGDPQPLPRGPALTWRRIMAGGAVLAVLVAAIVGGVRLNAGRRDTAAPTEANQPLRSVDVVLEAARRMQFERALSVQGNVEAKRVALVSPRIAGVLEAIFVDEGDRVEAGQTRLFQTDPVRLAKTVEVRWREVDVAEHSLREKQASLGKDQADYDKAEYDWNRYRDLFERDAADNDELKDAETEYRRCAAMLEHAKALIELAQAQLEQARSALAITQKDLDDSLFLAPISGRVTERFQEPGEMGDPGEPVLRIEDPTLVEVSVFLPAQAYGEVIPNETTMHVMVSAVDLGEHVVSYKSPTIDAKLRTFEARCLLHDPPPAVASGAMAHARVVLERRQGLGVPRDAIHNRAGGTVVFIAQGDKARMIPVTVGLEMNGMVEVVSEQLDETARVVVVGGYFLDPDATIKVLQAKP
ncbi:MAG TPA: efflux RND transporter periplasmic adaptor subunit [Phycisphaerae bacterium]|nr:efflux RND transporter periplasmic adaptor subunit [Phycisphaerae bacterium]